MASLSDILTTAQNLVNSVSNAAQTYLGVNGNAATAGMTAATLVKTGPGRLVMVSIIDGGSAAGAVYDTNSVSSTNNPIFTIPDSIGIVQVNIPVLNGIVVAPGTGQTITISYS